MFDSDCVILHTPTNGRASIRLGGGEGWGVARAHRQLRLLSARLGRGGTALFIQKYVLMPINAFKLFFNDTRDLYCTNVNDARSPCLLGMVPVTVLL